MRYSFYRTVVKTLKDKTYTRYPIYIRRIKMSDFGECELDKKNKRFIIHINRKLAQSIAIEIVIHEIGHVLAWGKDKQDHGRNWGIAYSKVYREYEKAFMK